MSPTHQELALSDVVEHRTNGVLSSRVRRSIESILASISEGVCGGLNSGNVADRMLSWISISVVQYWKHPSTYHPLGWKPPQLLRPSHSEFRTICSHFPPLFNNMVSPAQAQRDTDLIHRRADNRTWEHRFDHWSEKSKNEKLLAYFSLKHSNGDDQG